MTIFMRTIIFLSLLLFTTFCQQSRQVQVIEKGMRGEVPYKTLQVVLPEDNDPVMQNIASVFARQVEVRCGARVIKRGEASLNVILAIEPDIGAEGFRIIDGKAGTIHIIGNDVRGVLYGVGKFLRTSSYSGDGFTAGTWRGESVPEKPVRGIYFATHFYNYYHTAPVQEVEHYIEELALWGVNCLMVWYDMNHFQGFDDPKAIAHRDRLKRYMQAAGKLGVGVGLGVIGNEAYANSPIELRAVPGGSRGGNYPCDICPNKPGGMEYILNVLGEEFDWVQDLKPEYVWIWPYDQGGCGCDNCKPWGSNGFLKCAKSISEMAHQKLPGTKIILSTWFLDNHEWNELSQKLNGNSSWVDMILAENIPGAAPANLPMVGFPEISMHNTFPWGGFGATPLPKRIEDQWQGKRYKLDGGFPYSEGIYEDITKVTCAQLYWNSKKPLEEILKEYIAYEYSPDVVDDVLEVIKTLEKNHHWRWWPGELEGVKLTLDWFPSKGSQSQADPGAEEAYATVRQVDTRLPGWASTSWRWRILYIRTMLDAELKHNGGSPTEACEEGFRELMNLYHVTEDTEPHVRPPASGIANKN